LWLGGVAGTGIAGPLDGVILPHRLRW